MNKPQTEVYRKRSLQGIRAPKHEYVPWEALATVKIIELLGQGVDLRGSDYDWDAKCWRVQDHES